jgi:hypothetical protein
MNALERLLQDDLDHLIDRIAATTREGAATDCLGRRTELVSRLSEAETRLSTARRELLHGYVAWQDALLECSDLWAVVDLRADGTMSGHREAA